MAAVDCTTDNSVCSAFEVSGFPTFKYFHYFNKEQKAYDGGRTKKDFVAFLADPLSPFAGQPPPPPEPEEQWQGLQGAIFLKHLKSSEFEHYMRLVEADIVQIELLLKVQGDGSGDVLRPLVRTLQVDESRLCSGGRATHQCQGLYHHRRRAVWHCFSFFKVITQVKHVLATVDATVETELAQKYQVPYYWRIKI